MKRVERVVVGAGPQALTIVARWASERPDAIDAVRVVDPSGTWLAAWDRAMAGQRIDVLRSPGVHHPAPEEMAFVWAYGRSSGPPRTSRDPMTGPLRRPSTAAFSDFCVDLIDSSRLGECVHPASVVGLAPTGIGWTVELCTGESIESEMVVWAGNARRPRLPDSVDVGGPVVHAGELDLDTVSHGECLAVVGGGQSAGQVALEAHRRGASVMLVSRNRSRVADLDVDAGWLMDDHLGPFRATKDPRRRRRILDQVRCGSMTTDLDEALTASDVCRLQGVGPVDVRRSERGASLAFSGAEVVVDRVVLATGWVPDVRADRALSRLVDDGAPHVDGLPVLDARLQWQDGLFVAGALAGLTLGPAAGNLGGARAAAELLAPIASG